MPLLHAQIVDASSSFPLPVFLLHAGIAAFPAGFTQALNEEKGAMHKAQHIEGFIF
jgi:hypothetical protein